MRFQKTTEYAIRVMIFLANNRQERFSASELAKRLRIPYKYLTHLMSKLADAGLLDVRQGVKGGYRIIRDLNRIYLYQIAELVEGLEDYQRCVLGFPECSDDHPCALHSRWIEHREAIKAMIYETTLADLEEENPVQRP